MRRKVLFGVDYTNSEVTKILLYLLVGGTAALVEWSLFFVFINYLFIGWGLKNTALTMFSTAAAFCLSTLYHYILGNILVFDSGSRYQKGKELSLVFLVSTMGLFFNLLLMFIFVTLWAWPMMFSKILTSGIVVVWNYLSRKKWIFRS